MKTKVLIQRDRVYKDVIVRPLLRGELQKQTIEKWQQMVDYITKLCDISMCLIMVASETKFIEFIKSNNHVHPSRVYEDSHYKQGNFCETVIGLNEPLLVSNVETDEVFSEYKDHVINVVSYLGYPLSYGNGTMFGTLCLFDQKPLDLALEHKEVLTFIHDSIEKDLRLLVQTETINNLSVIDPLTGLYNKHKIDEIVYEYQQELNRQISMLSIAYLSIVNFDDIRQKYSDNDVDRMVILIAKIMKKRCRYVDRIGRIQNNQFIILSKGSEASGQEVLLRDLQKYLTTNLELEEYNLQIGYGNSEVHLKESIEEGMREAKANLEEYISTNF